MQNLHNLNFQCFFYLDGLFPSLLSRLYSISIGVDLLLEFLTLGPKKKTQEDVYSCLFVASLLARMWKSEILMFLLKMKALT